MARDPDALETESTRREDTAHGQMPGMEFTTGPTRAERSLPRERQSTPLWPWLAIILVVVLAGVIYALVQ